MKEDAGKDMIVNPRRSLETICIAKKKKKKFQALNPMKLNLNEVL